ncbi:hypothetical protein C8F04DRAFT_1177504 [Mycena alexandri]|uniref:Uncharacterized protein n=1 Tax=Mycena alexandri TaxID=1745969 RepID=A0AAD6X6J8_9AGAR|nr:hypothetical protein C8F04DRAFT_1177504 [Mycena alexandri]
MPTFQPTWLDGSRQQQLVQWDSSTATGRALAVTSSISSWGFELPQGFNVGFRLEVFQPYGSWLDRKVLVNHWLSTVHAVSAVDQQNLARATHSLLVQLRHDTADRLNSLHLEIEGSQSALVTHISNNLKILRELGASTKAIGHAISKMSDLPLASPKMAPLPKFKLGDDTDITPAARSELDGALPPRTPHESTEEFNRRAQFALDGRRRAASAFAFDVGPTDTSTAHVQQRAETHARMNPANNVSMANTTAPQTPGLGFGPDVTIFGDAVSHAEGVLEEYHAENDRKIAAIIHRQVGEVLDVPSRIKALKLPSPSMFSGSVNDPAAILTYVETMATWMRAQFMGGPEADTYRVTLLKTLLTGNALEWFIEHVEGQNGPVTVPYEFTSVVCALHRRFITFATAEKASRAFDQVRYKAEDGPSKFMDDLVSASRKMREPMPDFVICQRFMRLIPEKIREHLVLHKGLSEVYSTIQQLRFHATYVWDGNAVLRTTPSASTQSSHPAHATAHPSNNRATRQAAPRTDVARVTPMSASAPPASKALATAGSDDSNPHSHKRCFKCGVIGHIGSDPTCPKNTGSSRPRMGLAAHRVVDSYAEDDFPEAAIAAVTEEVHNDWGGSQYEPEDDRDPNEAPDLTDLVGAEFESEDKARMGAMQIRYFSMRVILPEVDYSPSPEYLAWIASLTPLQAELAGLDLNFYERDPDALFGNSTIADVGRLNEARTESGLAEFTPEEYEAKRLELVLAHSYNLDTWTTFEELAFEFQARATGGPWSRAVTDEWNLILAFDAFEHARRDFQAIRIPRWEVIVLTSTLLEGRREALEEMSNRLDQLVPAMTTLRDKITVQRVAATSSLRELQGRPIPSRSRAAQIYHLVWDSYEQLLLDMQEQENALRLRAIRTQSFRPVILAELTRRDEPPRVALTQQGLTYLASIQTEDEGSRASTPGTPPPDYRVNSDFTYRASASPAISETEDGPSLSEGEAPPRWSAESNTIADVVTFMVDSAITGALQGQDSEAEGGSEEDGLSMEGAPEYATTDPLQPQHPDTAASDEPLSPGSEAALWAELPALEEAEDIIDGVTGQPTRVAAENRDRVASIEETHSGDVPSGDAPENPGGATSHDEDENTPSVIRLMSNRIVASDNSGADPSEYEQYAESRLGEVTYPDFVQAMQDAGIEEFCRQMLRSRFDSLEQAAAWEATPGIFNEPSNPDEPIDERRVWINGVGADYGDRFISVLDTLGHSAEPADPSTDSMDIVSSLLQDHSGSESSRGSLTAVINPVELHRPVPEPSDDDVLLIRSVVRILGSPAAELYLTYVDRHGTVYVKTQPLSPLHYLSPEMISAHQEAMDEAIRDRAEELNCPIAQIQTLVDGAESTIGTRDRQGYRDVSPHLFPGETFHERITTLGPEDDDEDALPEFRVQALSQQIERVSRIHRPDSLPSVGLVDQPSRKVKDIACLTAEVSVGGCTAYVLFDSGSNTDSLTPEYAKGTDCAVFRLADQVTLQLGCVGSKSRINYGARAPVSFGGIKGHAYFDIVNVDRYDGIIGAPFMIKHKKFNFPTAIAALAITDEVALVRRQMNTPAALALSAIPADPDGDERGEKDDDSPPVPIPYSSTLLQRRPRPPTEIIEVDDEEPSDSLPSLPHDSPFLLVLETDYLLQPTASDADALGPRDSDIPPLQDDDGEDYSEDPQGDVEELVDEEDETVPSPPYRAPARTYAGTHYGRRHLRPLEPGTGLTHQRSRPQWNQR